MSSKRNFVLAMTWGRIWAVGLLIIAFYGLPYTDLAPSTGPICCFIFSAAALTDWLDGFYARKWNVVSRFVTRSAKARRSVRITK